MRAIPVSARQRILQLYEEGRSTREIAQFFGFCVTAVRRVRQQFKERGSLEPQTHLCGRKTLLTSQRQSRLQKLVAIQPDATLAELGARLDRPFGTSTVDLWLRKLGLSYKKNAGRQRAKPPGRGRKKGPLA
jgi:transposase